jgi:hypothetical protein
MQANEVLSDHLFDCEYSDVGSNIEFSKIDQCHIFEQKNPTYLLAAAIISDSRWLWWRNTSARKVEKFDIHEKKLYYQHLIIKDLFSYTDAATDKYSLTFYKKIADQLIEIDNENSYPYYLKAILLHLFSSSLDSVLEQIEIGNGKNIYDDYSRFKYQIIRDTAFFLNYSPFTAPYYANMKTEYAYFTVPPRILKICESVQKEEDRMTCIQAGRIIEKNGLFATEQLYGQFIQSKASGNLDNGLKDRQKKLKDKILAISDLKLSNQIEERKFIQLIDDIYVKGEVEAYEIYFQDNSR